MSKFNKGDRVTLVRAADRFMQAARHNLGKSGEVTAVIRDGSLVYAEVTLDNGAIEHCEAQALTMRRRASRMTSKREEVAYV